MPRSRPEGALYWQFLLNRREHTVSLWHHEIVWIISLCWERIILGLKGSKKSVHPSNNTRLARWSARPYGEHFVCSFLTLSTSFCWALSFMLGIDSNYISLISPRSTSENPCTKAYHLDRFLNYTVSQIVLRLTFRWDGIPFLMLSLKFFNLL